MIQTQATLTSKISLASDVCRFVFSVADSLFSYVPGQYVILTIPHPSGPVKRLYSLAGNSSEKNTFELIIKLVEGGAASGYLTSLAIGDSVEIAGPAGLFKEQPTTFRKIYMATGTGIAPIRSFLLSKDEKSVNSVLYWGMRNTSEAYLMDELIRIRKSALFFDFYYCLSQQSPLVSIPADLLQYFRTGHIDAVWDKRTTPPNPDDEYYLCGSRIVIESLRLHLLSQGISKEKLFFEKY